MEEEKRFYVYVYLNPFKKGSFTYCDINLEYQPFYIGKGANGRYLKHLTRAKSILKHRIDYDTRNRKINKIISILNRGKEPIIRIVKDFMTEIEAYKMETEMIDYFGIKDMHTNGILYNYETGGRGGYTVSKESREKMRCAALGRKLPQHVIDMLVAINTGKARPKTKEQIEKQRKSLLKSYASGKIQPWNKGLIAPYTQTEESNEKRRKAIKGRKYTEEHCKNISEGQKKAYRDGTKKVQDRLLNQSGENNHMYGKIPYNAKKIVKYDLDGNFIKEYDSGKEACDDNGKLYPAKLKEICEKEIEYKGFIFKYK